MTVRGHATLAITFGPSRSPEFPRAVEFAQVNAGAVEVEPGRWRATFELGELDQVPYARAADLLHAVKRWRSMRVEVDGEAERWYVATAMLECARGYLRTWGRCGFRYRYDIPQRCGPCPLFDRDRAMVELEMGDLWSRLSSEGPE